MKTIRLSRRELLRGYDTVAKLYGTVPPLSMWRAWETAAYKKFKLSQPVLDLGCGDGNFFRLIWPKIKDVTGIDADKRVTDLAKASGVYREVITSRADQMQFGEGTFASCFANCSLEHMDNLDGVLQRLARVMKTDGQFLFSVATDRFVAWNSVPQMLHEAGHAEVAAQMQQQFLDYHHLVNPLSTDAWISRVTAAGFSVDACVPIIPEFSSRVFLALDSAWHIVRAGGGELGDAMHARFKSIAKFDRHARAVIEGLFGMDAECRDTSGAVIFARKK